MSFPQFKLFTNAEKKSLNIQMNIEQRKRNRFTEKISLKLRFLPTNPACFAGVRTSAPNVNAECGLMKLLLMRWNSIERKQDVLVKEWRRIFPLPKLLK